MQLNKVTLENYGLYREEKVFDLAPKNKKPIILFGGKNGAGKTTFLNSIRLALYGKRSLGDRVTQAQYDEFLVSKIHRHQDLSLQVNKARVALEFDFVTQGEIVHYLVERSWVKEGRKVKETAIILKNGQPLNDVDSEFWESFISETIPERLSQLFFFDGEKIQDIADDIKGNAAIADAVQTLLGLDLVDKLKADLNIYRSRQIQEASNKKEQGDLKALSKKINHKASEIAQSERKAG